ncbi:L-lysine 6-transaminase [Geoalkalibacter halelectricus]|uniref:L-lysine-epsilon aminotransferase n=1 Tax=Geoalkalibacter halelectricus TaxID=2847045 RepID=A0ABY5ZRT4_9BACT|nr:L-lysine 6-transaminase [Geoalkalibacter halelectricus]MDO3379886.1 L-lysine 6-transaminase [Geoalkalibacter halelectricus]UWZ80585.1 L-lysine 6-transaminase [Geoalkalibacter halelectricus]
MPSIAPQDVKQCLSRHLLTEGFDIILDLERSAGSWFVDQRNGEHYLDFFSMYASMAVGYNHPRLRAKSPELGRLAVNKPANSDVYTQAMAEFVETFSRIAVPAELPHMFFIEGGALAVENALKTAFDWKVRKNLARGRTGEVGSQVVHFRQAFHGRSGYTLSLTNTADERKTKYFPKFAWPRLPNPKLSFPLSAAGLSAVQAVETQALRQLEKLIAQQGEELAALIIEPIQGEGGDNHFRAEFFQALRRLCDAHDILLIFDEVQTGVGLTGRFWAYEHFGVRPDILVFGKKTQVCGILVSRRIEEVGCHVFAERSRINSTFGGNLIDMVRCAEILRIIEEEQLVDNARRQGELLLAELEKLAADFPEVVGNPRGRGLMCAFDAPDGRTRDQLIKAFYQNKLLMVGCGRRGIRFRPHLIVTAEEIRQGLAIIRQVLEEGRYVHLEVFQDPCLLVGP